MTNRPTKVVINCSTGEREIIELTDAEIAEREAMAAQAEADRLEREAEEAARLEAKASAESKLAALGLTAEEIAALTA
jgi:ATPase subunit of ABC transporter with duplicated ATPase domains